MKSYWTIIKEVQQTGDHQKNVLCRCICGKEKTVRLTTIKQGKSKSCGCKKNPATGIKSGVYKHGKSQTAEYRSYRAMIGRCYDKKNDSYEYYGGRGIKVCNRWLKFENFYEDMGDRPKGKSIDRFPDVNGNYEPSNCRWATLSEQNKNRRSWS